MMTSIGLVLAKERPAWRERSAVRMSWTAARGKPTSSSDSRNTSAIAALVCSASEPPFRSTALPDLRQSAAASAVTFGRDS